MFNMVMVGLSIALGLMLLKLALPNVLFGVIRRRKQATT